MAEDDLVLFERWCRGDQSAGQQLFHRHVGTLIQFFEHKIEHDDAADLVQETLLACVRCRDGFRRTSSFRTYLFAIARNVLLTYWKKKRARGESLDVAEVSIASLSTTAGTRLDRRVDRARLLAAMRHLPLDQRTLIELHYWRELDRDELAEVFDIEPATTRSRLHRARAALRDRLARADGGTPITFATDDDLETWTRELRPAPEIRNAPDATDTTGS